MPRGDKTGPRGEGSMTGRGLGYCTGSNAPGFASPTFGRGGGFGRGRGFRRMYYATGLPAWARYPAPVQAPQMTKDQETQILEQDKQSIESELSFLKQELENIKKRLSKFKK